MPFLRTGRRGDPSEIRVIHLPPPCLARLIFMLSCHLGIAFCSPAAAASSPASPSSAISLYFIVVKCTERKIYCRNHWKLYNSVALSTSTVQPLPISGSRSFSSARTETLYPLEVPPYFPRPPTAANLCSVSVALPMLKVSRKGNRMTCGLSHLPSFKVHPCCNPYENSIPFHGRIIFRFVGTPCCLSVHLRCVQLLAVVSGVAAHTRVQVFV